MLGAPKTQIRSTKSEARNPKQIQMFKKHKNPNNFNLDSAFWIFFGFGFIWLRFVSDFVLRISDFVWPGSLRLNSGQAWRDKFC